MQSQVNSIQDIISRELELVQQEGFGLLSSNALNFLTSYSVGDNQSDLQLVKLMRILTSIFFIQPHNQLPILAIYEKYTNELSRINHSLCNSFAANLYNMTAYLKLQETDGIPRAKYFYKKVAKFTCEDSGCDQALLSLSLNNLAVLYLGQKSYQKSFMYTIKAYQIMKRHLQALKKSKDPTIRQKAVIFVNSCYILRESLRGRLDLESPTQADRNQYFQYIELFHKEGYKKALKYLGRGSYFVKLLEKRNFSPRSQNFIKDMVWKHQLPVMYQNLRETQGLRNFKTLTDILVERVNPKLDSLLSTLIVYQQQRRYAPSPPPTPPPQLPQQEIVLQLTKHFPITKECSIKIVMFKGKVFRFGSIIIEIFVNGKFQARQEVDQQVLATLLVQLQKDTASFQVNPKTCSLAELVQHFLLPFVYLQGGGVIISPRCRGLYHEKLVKFFDQQCLVFLSHVKANEFRLAICPLDMVQALYVSVCISETVIQQVIANYTDNFIVDRKVQDMLMGVKGQSMNVQSFQPLVKSEVQFINLHLLWQEIDIIVRGLELFVKEHKLAPARLRKLFKPSPGVYRFFKYKVEDFKGRGCFYGIRNTDKCLEIVMQNQHLSMDPNGKIQAKGYHTMSYEALKEGMGIEQLSKYQATQVNEILSMVSQMFHLHIYQDELQKDEKELYCQNAIRVGKLVDRVFRRVYRKGEPYMYALTATVVTINSETPLGIKVEVFNYDTLRQTGCFLRLDKRRWLKEKPPKPVKDTLRMSKVSNRSSTSVFNRNRKQQPPALLNYLFDPILTHSGFQALLQQIPYDQVIETFALFGPEVNRYWGRLQEVLTQKILAKYLPKVTPTTNV